METNLQRQIDELEVLHSIYGNEWQQCPTMENTYSIQLEKDVELWITLNHQYPSNHMPSYEILAPNLSKSQKDYLNVQFTEIYEAEKGCIIFQWIDKLRETIDDNKTDFAQERSPEPISVPETKHSNLEIFHGTPIMDRKSTFQGHVSRITHPSQVGEFLDVLMENKKIAQATHNILAYRIVRDKIVNQDFEDDGETHAGGRLLHLLEILDLENIAVVVTRWYGGIHLGPDRFKHINNAARQTLVEAGIIP